MAMSDWTDTNPVVEVTVTGLDRTFETIDSTVFDDPNPDLLEIVGQVFPSATFTDPD